MNRAFTSEIVRALSIHALPKDSAERLSRFPAVQWRRSLRWFHASGIALYFWRRMKESSAEAVVPPDVQAILEDCLVMNRERLARMSEEFRSVSRAFQESEVRHAVLKGFALVPDYCPDAALRNQYDFDFLVPPESLALVDRRLRNVGFIRKEQSRCTHPVVYLAFDRQTQPPANLDDVYSPLIHRSVEVHTRLWDAEAEKIAFELPANPLARARKQYWSGIEFYSLSPEDLLVFQVLHAFRHMLNNKCRLSIFLEIAQFLDAHAGDGAFWPKFAALLAGRMRLREAAAVVFSLAASLFAPRNPPAMSALLGRSVRPATVLWVERYSVRLALENFSSNKDSLHLHKLFVENPEAWAFVKRRKLYPAQLPAMPQDSRSGGMRARYRQAIHIARRVYFHSSSALRYWWGLPSWGYGVWAANRTARTVFYSGTVTGLAASRKAVLKLGENDDGLRS